MKSELTTSGVSKANSGHDYIGGGGMSQASSGHDVSRDCDLAAKPKAKAKPVTITASVGNAVHAAS